MNIRNVDLNLLIVFEAVRRHRTVSKAASALGLPQPTVSNALRRLRDIFDDQLFVRAAGGVMPTPFAEQISSHVSDGIAAFERTLQFKNEFDPAQALRLFTILMTDIAEAIILPRLLEACRRTAPGVSFRTTQLPADAIVPALRSGDVDLAIGYMPSLRTGLMQQMLFMSDYACLASARHSTIRRQVTGQIFRNARHAIAEAQGTGHDVVEKLLRKHGLDRQIGARVPHFLALPMIVASSDMLATVPRPLGKLMQQIADIRIYNHPLPLPQIAIRQFWHERFNDDPGNKWLRATFRKVLAQPMKADDILRL
ncbi:MAG: LysR family transcriptional regulator [Pseudorhodoplanes sp.]|uniref:LysR family transcriptional regulator n=1 Tax=Pseudorhodoplanes sp. TaxID=1934341 RepID=UPI003D12AF13